MEYNIDMEYHDTRIDKFIRKHYKGVNLTDIFKLIRKGRVKVNGKKVKQNYRLQDGDTVKTFFKADTTEEKSFITLTNGEHTMLTTGIVYEDDTIVLFNKKPNMVMHKGSGHEYGLSEMFKAYYSTNNFTFVNRIDRATSGIIIGSKTLVTTRALSEDIRDRNVVKKYYVLVDGDLAATINNINDHTKDQSNITMLSDNKFQMKSYLEKVDSGVIEHATHVDGAKECITTFTIVDSNHSNAHNSATATLLQAELHTGRTHQLRVQLANFGHPIVGDKKYGISSINGSGDRNIDMCLFSYYISIPRYNITKQLDIPTRFSNLLANG